MRTYIGVRGPRGEALVEVERNGIRTPLRHIVQHSPSGLEWGYGGSGPADLAFSMLEDAAPGSGQLLFKEFMWEYVAAFPDTPRQAGFQRDEGDVWRITDEEVKLWIAARSRECPHCIGRVDWPLGLGADPRCRTCHGAGIVGREARPVDVIF